MPKTTVLPVTSVATVVGLHDITSPDELPVLTAEPVIAWAVKDRRMKPLDHDMQHLISLHPITPSYDGIPTPFEPCSHTLGWIVVHGILTMSILRDQTPILVHAALTDFCDVADERNAHYVDEDGLTDNSPEALLHGKGKWAAETKQQAEFLEIVTKKLVMMSELVEQEDWDLDRLTLSEELLHLVVH